MWKCLVSPHFIFHKYLTLLTQGSQKNGLRNYFLLFFFPSNAENLTQGIAHARQVLPRGTFPEIIFLILYSFALSQTTMDHLSSFKEEVDKIDHISTSTFMKEQIVCLDDRGTFHAFALKLMLFHVHGTEEHT